ncbi:MAG: phosphohistidine phosphatase SixA [Planctomycetales bacterium]
MQVWLVRHAIAAEITEFPGPDSERPLTEKGKKQFRQFGAWLEEQGVRPDAVLTSPLVRAVETAELLRKALGLKKTAVTQSPELSPGVIPQTALQQAQGASLPSIALVGHEPDLSGALSAFIGGGRIAFGKGCIAAVEFGENPTLGTGQLLWFVGPRLR